METMIKCGYLLLIAFLIAWAVSAEELTTGNLLPNGTNNSSSYQSVDNTIPSVSTNGFNVVGTVRDWGQELETTGTGSINYTGNLTDHATQQQLNNGITLDSTTIVQNCEWQGSAWQCGQARQGRDTYTTTVKILDDEGNTLAITNQTRNNDAGYGANAFKYEDSVSYTGTGSNQFYWEWEGVDEGSFVNMGGPNLLGAKLTMTYDDTVIEEETIELIEEVIEQFEEWEQSFIEPVPIEEFIPIPIALEEFGIVQLEEEIIFEEIVTTLEEEFEEVEILQAFGGPEIVEEEPEVTEETPTETTALTEEPMEEQPEQSETTTVATVQEEPTSEPSSNEQVAVDVQDIQAQVAVKIKAIDKQLAVTNIIVAETMEKQQVDISSYYKQYTDKRQLYEGNVYEDLRMLDDGEIYQNDNRFAAISLNDPVRDYQEQLQKATLIRIQKEKELQVLRRQYAR
jgi:outer membrane biosynthesis protein TonB